ncbi:hypothetical protein REPUB_Repub12eG0084300 [Reevesia pubescens]
MMMIRALSLLMKSFAKLGLRIRAHEPQDLAGKPGKKGVGNTAKLQLEELYSPKNKKFRESSSACSPLTEIEPWYPVSELNIGLGFKRKNLMDDVSSLKKLKINETNSDFQGGGNSNSSTGSSTPFKCSYLSGKTLKRMGEDEVIVAASCKRISSGCNSPICLIPKPTTKCQFS